MSRVEGQDPPGLMSARDAIVHKIHEDSQNEDVKRRAESIAPSGTTVERAVAFKRWVDRNVSLLSIGGHGDADDCALAFGTLCEAVGIETRLVLEQVGEHSWTIHVEVKLEEGTWYRAP